AIQKRIGGSVGFNRTREEYERGFGDVTDSYWIGNDIIHQMSKGRNSSLYVSITLTNGTTLYELYHQFSISDESDNYRLFLGNQLPGLWVIAFNTNDDLSGMNFSTPDRDNDGNDRDGRAGNCAAWYGGGWWFIFCYAAFLNGPWSPAQTGNPWWPTLTDNRERLTVLYLIVRDCKEDCSNDKTSLTVSYLIY
ncbi:ryncolin-1-like, partial [Saccostrea cucullata]|uniref:ryncolin-1-like n=1 Tax=Saccostrea cuccullata TaxID=36930 RepID=UPI002ED4F719